jgi:hypothetical protein
VVTVGAPDHVFSRPQHAGNVVDGHTELEEHRRASVSEDVRGNFGTEGRQFPRRPPRPPLFGLDGAPGIFDGKSRREPAPAAEVRR